MRAKLLFPDGAPGRRRAIVSAAKLVKTPDELACIRTAIRITDEAMVDVQAAWRRASARSTCRPSFLRRAFELGAMASMLEPIWQVMPTSKADGVWTTHGDLALPLLTTERELAAGDVLWTDVSITYQRLLLGLRPHLDRRPGSDAAPAGAIRASGAKS